MMSASDLEKIRELIRTEDFPKQRFVEEHRYYGNWEGECESCQKYISDDDEVLVIDRKDLAEREEGALIFCRHCYKKLIKLLFSD